MIHIYLDILVCMFTHFSEKYYIKQIMLTVGPTSSQLGRWLTGLGEYHVIDSRPTGSCCVRRICCGNNLFRWLSAFGEQKQVTKVKPNAPEMSQATLSKNSYNFSLSLKTEFLYFLVLPLVPVFITYPSHCCHCVCPLSKNQWDIYGTSALIMVKKSYFSTVKEDGDSRPHVYCKCKFYYFFDKERFIT
jgi:hypothetical protein